MYTSVGVLAKCHKSLIGPATRVYVHVSNERIVHRARVQCANVSNAMQLLAKCNAMQLMMMEKGIVFYGSKLK